MDGTVGATDVPVSCKGLGRFRTFIGLLALLVALVAALPAFALVENQPIHFTGKKQKWDRRANIVELFGDGTVTQPGETLKADYIKLDLNTRLLDASGNCVYIASDSVIWGDEMHFNLNTRAGTVISGRVANGNFTLRGEKIDKLGPGLFKTKWGDYTTCRDCAASWSMLAEDVDMEVEGYAYLRNVTVRIKGAPALWFPILIIPTKTQRQSGFLFPPMSFSGDSGATFVLPYFWAMDRSADMTFGLGIFTNRGLRATTEGRYALNGGSGRLNIGYLTDKTFPYRPHRWAVDVVQSHELPWGIDEKFHFAETSDNIYPFLFGGDFTAGRGEAFLPSTLAFSRSSDEVSAFVALQRYRNLLTFVPNDPSAQNVDPDPKTVQVYPQVLVTTHDKYIGNTPFVGGLSVGFSNFTRTSGGFDYDTLSVPFGSAVPATPPAFTPGQDPIRKAVRFSVVPTLYTTTRIFDAVSISPSVAYKGYFYNFGDLAPPLGRGYIHFQTDLMAQIEKIYEFPDDPKIPRAKHLIRPILNYSLIPLIVQDSSHPFVRQINYALDRNIAGYYFDNYDIIPYTYTVSGANYFLPQGNSLTYGLTSQWIRRLGAVDSESPGYATTVEFSAGQGINFLELIQPRDPSDPRVFTRFFAALGLSFSNFTSSTNYSYNTEVPASAGRHSISTSMAYILERSTHQNVLSFDRSFGFSYAFSQLGAVTSNLTGNVTYSISDYLMPSISLSYDFVTRKLFQSAFGLRIQSPSRCWRITTGVDYRIETRNLRFSFDWELNLTGSGFGRVGEIANQMVGRYANQ